MSKNTIEILKIFLFLIVKRHPELKLCLEDNINPDVWGLVKDYDQQDHLYKKVYARYLRVVSKDKYRELRGLSLYELYFIYLFQQVLLDQINSSAEFDFPTLENFYFESLSRIFLYDLKFLTRRCFENLKKYNFVIDTILKRKPFCGTINPKHFMFFEYIFEQDQYNLIKKCFDDFIIENKNLIPCQDLELGEIVSRIEENQSAFFFPSDRFLIILYMHTLSELGVLQFSSASSLARHRLASTMNDKLLEYILGASIYRTDRPTTANPIPMPPPKFTLDTLDIDIDDSLSDEDDEDQNTLIDENKNKLFVSHNEEDQKIVKILVDHILACTEIDIGNINSSFSEKFGGYINGISSHEIYSISEESKVCFAIYTSNPSDSHSMLFELGALWSHFSNHPHKKIYSVVIAGEGQKLKTERIPLVTQSEDDQMIYLEREEDLSRLVQIVGEVYKVDIDIDRDAFRRKNVFRNIQKLLSNAIDMQKLISFDHSVQPQSYVDIEEMDILEVIDFSIDDHSFESQIGMSRLIEIKSELEFLIPKTDREGFNKGITEFSFGEIVSITIPRNIGEGERLYEMDMRDKLQAFLKVEFDIDLPITLEPLSWANMLAFLISNDILERDGSTYGDAVCFKITPFGASVARFTSS